MGWRRNWEVNTNQNLLLNVSCFLLLTLVTSPGRSLSLKWIVVSPSIRFENVFLLGFGVKNASDWNIVMQRRESDISHETDLISDIQAMTLNEQDDLNQQYESNRVVTFIDSNVV